MSRPPLASDTMTAVAPTTQTAYLDSEDELRAVIGYPIQRVVDKVLPRLGDLHRQWIAAVAALHRRDL